jgi:small subunit ribosomal protein S6
MVKTMKKNLYEGIFILRTSLSDDAKEKALSKISTVIVDGGGSIKKVIDWGRKKLAYQIKDAREGRYYVIYFDLPTTSIKEFIRENSLNEDLLRSMHILVENVPEADVIEFKVAEIKNERE